MSDHAPLSDEIEQIKELELRQVVEAALYLAGRPLTLTELTQVTGAETSSITAAIRDLQERYRQFFSCFEIIELPGKKFVFQVKADVGEKVKDITLQPLLSVGELRTLAMIAYQQPVLQSKVVKVRGQQAYAHIKTLLRNGFVQSAPVKQTLELRTTAMFSDYFGLSQDQGVLKRQLGWRTKRLIKDKQIVEERDSKSIEDFMSKIGIGDSTESDDEKEVDTASKEIHGHAQDFLERLLDDDVSEPTSEVTDEDSTIED